MKRLPTEYKPFTWSPSALKSYGTCPVQYWANYWDPKRAKFEDTPATLWGKEVHKAFELAVQNDDAVLPRRFEHYQKWLTGIRELPGDKLPEMKVGITRDWKQTGFFDDDVWIRLIIDLTIKQDNKCVVLDYKTGNSRYDNDDQLKLGMIASREIHPSDNYAAGYIYLKEDHSTYLYSDNDGLEVYKKYFESKIKPVKDSVDTGIFEPKPSGLCKRYCNVTICPHNGR